MTDRLALGRGVFGSNIALTRGIAVIAVMLVGVYSASAKPGNGKPFKQLQAQIDVLNDTVQDQVTDLEALQEALSQAQTDIGTLQTDLATALGLIGTLDTQVQSQDQQIQDLTTENQNQDQAIADLAAMITKEVRAFVYSNRGLGGDFIVINPAPLNNPGSSVVEESAGVFLVTLDGPVGSFPNAGDSVAVATPEVDADAPGSGGPTLSATVAQVAASDTNMQYRVRIHDADGNPVTAAFNLVILSRD
jgi:hypothetical protein